MNYELRLPNSGPKSDWSNFIHQNRLKNFEGGIGQASINFSDCAFIEPFHVVALACLIEEYYLNGFEIVFLECNNLELCEYLSKINFFNYWNANFNRNSFTPSLIRTNLPLWKLDSTRISSYVIEAQNYFETNFLRGKDVEPLNTSLAEAFNNIHDHADSPVGGYCLSQFYPHSNKLKIAVCDFGKGIPFLVNEYFNKIGKPKIEDHEAISLAFQKSFSTKTTPQNKGFGLDTIKNIVLNSNGSLRIYSNQGVYFLDGTSNKAYATHLNFQGTHIEIILDTTTFHEKENEFFENDFEL